MSQQRIYDGRFSSQKRAKDNTPVHGIKNWFVTSNNDVNVLSSVHLPAIIPNAMEFKKVSAATRTHDVPRNITLCERR